MPPPAPSAHRAGSVQNLYQAIHRCCVATGAGDPSCASDRWRGLRPATGSRHLAQGLPAAQPGDRRGPDRGDRARLVHLAVRRPRAAGHAAGAARHTLSGGAAEAIWPLRAAPPSVRGRSSHRRVRRALDRDRDGLDGDAFLDDHAALHQRVGRMSSLRAPERARPGEPCVRIGLGFDGRAFARDPGYTERIVDLFRTLASELRCVYAAASVNRGAIARRSSISSDYLTETGPLPRADRWIGLPASPTWLAWFGQPYAAPVRPSVTSHITAEEDGAFFLRMGTEPMNADELANRFPPLPTNLVAHRINQPAAWVPRGSYTLTAGPPSQPAAEIPPIRAEEPLAADLLRSVLEGLELLFSEAGIVGWRDRVRSVGEQPDAGSIAKAYLAMSEGSAAGTFHDLIISLFNGHPVTERQEPWINELLSTFQSIGVLAARAIKDRGTSARLPMSSERPLRCTRGARPMLRQGRASTSPACAARRATAGSCWTAPWIRGPPSAGRSSRLQGASHRCDQPA